MRKRLLTGVAALLLAFPAFAQEAPFPKTFSLEAGTGIAPMHTRLLAPSWETRQALATNGQDVDDPRYPSFSLSGVWRVKPNTEYALCAGLSWCNYQVLQFDVFGTDPAGRPRYAAWKEGTPTGRKSGSFIPSLVFRFRHLYNPDKLLVVYSGAGLGWTLPTSLLPLPDLTPLGLRLQCGPFRVFAECTVSPVATLAHGGLGWTF